MRSFSLLARRPFIYLIHTKKKHNKKQTTQQQQKWQKVNEKKGKMKNESIKEWSELINLWLNRQFSNESRVFKLGGANGSAWPLKKTVKKNKTKSHKKEGESETALSRL